MRWRAAGQQNTLLDICHSCALAGSGLNAGFCLQLELVADAGFAVVIILVVVVITDSCSHGLPSLHDGGFALVGFKSSGQPQLTMIIAADNSNTQTRQFDLIHLRS